MQDDRGNKERIGDLVLLDTLEEQGVDEFGEDDDGYADGQGVVDEPMLRGDEQTPRLIVTKLDDLLDHSIDI